MKVFIKIAFISLSIILFYTQTTLAQSKVFNNVYNDYNYKKYAVNDGFISLFPNPADNYVIVQNPSSGSNNPSKFPSTEGVRGVLLGFQSNYLFPQRKRIKKL
jgi:hypothetical protein